MWILIKIRHILWWTIPSLAQRLWTRVLLWIWLGFVHKMSSRLEVWNSRCFAYSMCNWRVLTWGLNQLLHLPSRHGLLREWKCRVLYARRVLSRSCHCHSLPSWLQMWWLWQYVLLHKHPQPANFISHYHWWNSLNLCGRIAVVWALPCRLLLSSSSPSPYRMPWWLLQQQSGNEFVHNLPYWSLLRCHD